MTLRLVSDSEPQQRNAIVAAARAFADAVEAGDVPAEKVIVVCVVGGMLDLAIFGPSPTIAEGLGLLDLAKAKVIEGSWR